DNHGLSSSSTSISGNDHTNRLTSSITSVVCRWLLLTAANPSWARCQRVSSPTSAAATGYRFRAPSTIERITPRLSFNEREWVMCTSTSRANTNMFVTLSTLQRCRERSVEVELGPIGALQLGHAARRGDDLDRVPQLESRLAARDLGDHRTEEAGFVVLSGVERDDRCADVFAGAFERQRRLGLDVRVVRFVERGLGETGRKIGRLQEAFHRGDRVVDDLRAALVVVDRLAEHRVQRADLLVAEVDAHLIGNAKTVQAGHVTGAVLGCVPIAGAMLVDHLQADEAPLHLVMPQLLDLGDPTGGDPGPRAHRIEKELEIGHASRLSAGSPAQQFYCLVVA